MSPQCLRSLMLTLTTKRAKKLSTSAKASRPRNPCHDRSAGHNCSNEYLFYPRGRENARAGRGRRGCQMRKAAIRVRRQWRGLQLKLAPANYATRDSTRAGRGRRGRQLHTASHPSQSSVAT